MTAPKPKLRWFQYSLRTLMVFVTLCAIPCSWLAVKMQQVKRQREAVAAIEKLGGIVLWSGDPSGPAWVRGLLGDDFYRSVLVVLARSDVTDAGLENLKGLNNLKMLDIHNTQVTDAGLQHLKGLNQLQLLGLSGTKVTDAGLEYLTGLTQLQSLGLSGTKVTDAGLENLKGLTQLQELDLSYVQVTDAGLEHLKGLKQLQWLDLRDTNVTDAGVKKLQQALPNCVIWP
jgi:hypothetical protein